MRQQQPPPAENGAAGAPSMAAPHGGWSSGDDGAAYGANPYAPGGANPYNGSGVPYYGWIRTLQRRISILALLTRLQAIWMLRLPRTDLLSTMIQRTSHGFATIWRVYSQRAAT